MHARVAFEAESWVGAGAWLWVLEGFGEGGREWGYYTEPVLGGGGCGEESGEGDCSGGWLVVGEEGREWGRRGEKGLLSRTSVRNGDAIDGESNCIFAVGYR